MMSFNNSNNDSDNDSYTYKESNSLDEYDEENIKYLVEAITNIPKNEHSDISVPEIYGLQNSFEIIPKYYQKKNKSYISIDFYEIIKDDIRNMRKLNEYQIKYISKLDHDDKMEIINLLNNSLDSVLSLINM
jgi:hypothetical protein